MSRTIKIIRRVQQGHRNRNIMRYIIIGERWKSEVFYAVLNYIYGNEATILYMISLVNKFGENWDFENLEDGQDYHMLFEKKHTQNQTNIEQNDPASIQRILKEGNIISVKLPEDQNLEEFANVTIEIQQKIQELAQKLNSDKVSAVHNELINQIGRQSTKILDMRYGLNEEINPTLQLSKKLKRLTNESQEVAKELRGVLDEASKIQRRPNSKLSTPKKLTKPPVHDRVLRQYGVNIAELARFTSWQEPSAPEPVKAVPSNRQSQISYAQPDPFQKQSRQSLMSQAHPEPALTPNRLSQISSIPAQSHSPTSLSSESLNVPSPTLAPRMSKSVQRQVGILCKRLSIKYYSDRKVKPSHIQLYDWTTLCIVGTQTKEDIAVSEIEAIVKEDESQITLERKLGAKVTFDFENEDVWGKWINALRQLLYASGKILS